MPLVRDTKYIREHGGCHWAYIPVTSAGLVSAEAYVDGVYRESSEMTNNQEITPLYCESGAQVASKRENRTVQVSIVSMQDDVATEKFLSEEVEDNYYSIFMAAGDEDDAYNKIRWFPICRIKSDYTVSAPGRRPTITILPQVVPTTIEPTGSVTLPSWITVTSGSFSVAAGKYYSVVSQSGAAIL